MVPRNRRTCAAGFAYNNGIRWQALRDTDNPPKPGAAAFPPNAGRSETSSSMPTQNKPRRGRPQSATCNFQPSPCRQKSIYAALAVPPIPFCGKLRKLKSAKKTHMPENIFRISPQYKRQLRHLTLRARVCSAKNIAGKNTRKRTKEKICLYKNGTKWDKCKISQTRA